MSVEGQPHVSSLSPLTCGQRLLHGRHGGLDVSVLKGHGCLHDEDAAVAQRMVHTLLPPTPSSRCYTEVKQCQDTTDQLLHFNVTQLLYYSITSSDI